MEISIAENPVPEIHRAPVYTAIVVEDCAVVPAVPVRGIVCRCSDQANLTDVIDPVGVSQSLKKQ